MHLTCIAVPEVPNIRNSIRDVVSSLNGDPRIWNSALEGYIPLEWLNTLIDVVSSTEYTVPAIPLCNFSADSSTGCDAITGSNRNAADRGFPTEVVVDVITGCFNDSLKRLCRVYVCYKKEYVY